MWASIIGGEWIFFVHHTKYGLVVQLVRQGAISHFRLGTNIRTLPHFVLIIIVPLNSLQKFSELLLKRTIKVDSSDHIYVRKEKEKDTPMTINYLLSLCVGVRSIPMEMCI
jgi:hypothetical protein